MKQIKGLLAIVGGVFLIASCSLLPGKKGGKPTAINPGQLSTATNLQYNDDQNGGFQVKEFEGQPDAPNTVFIEGGRAIMGSFEEDVMSYRDNVERTVSVASFYMDETEIANIHWLEYMHYLAKDSSQEVYQAALPDTLVWVGKLAFNDPYVDHYLRYPGFRYFPVVGVSWKQATNYGKWRTTAVNQQLLKESGQDLPEVPAGGRIPLESGVVIPAYRLPTEAEWEYAAQALISSSVARSRLSAAIIMSSHSGAIVAAGSTMRKLENGSRQLSYSQTHMAMVDAEVAAGIPALLLSETAMY